MVSTLEWHDFTLAVNAGAKARSSGVFDGTVEADALAGEAEPTEMAAAEEVAEPSTEEAATEDAATAESATEEAAEDKKS